MSGRTVEIRCLVEVLGSPTASAGKQLAELESRGCLISAAEEISPGIWGGRGYAPIGFDPEPRRVGHAIGYLVADLVVPVGLAALCVALLLRAGGAW